DRHRLAGHVGELAAGVGPDDGVALLADRSQVHADRLARAGGPVGHGRHPAPGPRGGRGGPRPRRAGGPPARRRPGGGAGNRPAEGGGSEPAGDAAGSQTGVPGAGVKVNTPMPRLAPGRAGSVSVSTRASSRRPSVIVPRTSTGTPSGVVART